jgi:ABC-type molybdenum transport system ATPase subunit/photorepair protein PhrA
LFRIGAQEEIFKWVQTFELWKQELFRRTAVTPDLPERDVQEIADLLLGKGAPASELKEVSLDEFPGAIDGGDPLVVRSISELQNVNAIGNGQRIDFGPNLNVIYGRNGSGKTGYSRILKHAGRTLRRESVLTNVQSQKGGPPSAVITVANGDGEVPVRLNLEVPGPATLGRICIADADACDVYLTSDTEVDYIPASLNSVRRFTSGLRALDEELDRRRQKVNPEPLDVRPFADTTVSKMLSELTHQSKDQEILDLAQLDEEALSRKAELTKQRGAIEASETPKLRAAALQDAKSGEALLNDLQGAWERLSPPVVEAYLRELDEVKILEEAADAAAKQFKGQPLDGVGSDAWRRLWAAAEAFSQHLQQKLPVDHDPALCPLCMQPLSAEARGRLVQFGEFVKSDVNAKLGKSQAVLKERAAALPDLTRLVDRHSHVLDLMEHAHDEGVVSIRRWLDDAKLVARAISVGTGEISISLDPPPSSLQSWIEERKADANRYETLEQAADQQAVIAELAELEARHLLGERSEEILGYLAALRGVEVIDDAKRRLGRTAASRKMTELSRELIEANVQAALNRQLSALDFRGLEVVAKSKSPGGRPKLGLKFKTVDKVPLTAVLSKGEQRRLSLAMFLAELEVMSDPTPVVFDDPVSSIDQEGRRHIARTLLALAAHRQVIIFTHELSFIYELNRLASKELSIEVQQLRRRGKTVGHVSPGLPWAGLKARQRVEPLLKKLAIAQDLHAKGEEESYQGAATDYCVHLREAFERAVEEGVLADVVTRRSDTVHVLALKNICLNDEICDLVETGTNESSPWVHDRPRGDGSIPPTPEELSEGLEVYKALLAAIKKSKPGGKGSPGAKLEAVTERSGDSNVRQLRVADPPLEGAKDPSPGA